MLQNLKLEKMMEQKKYWR